MRPVRSVQVRQTTRSLRSEPTSAGSRGGTIDPVRVGLTALYMVLMFVTVYAETSIACDDRFLVWHAAFIAYETLALCAAALWPDSGSWMVVGIWTLAARLHCVCWTRPRVHPVRYANDCLPKGTARRSWTRSSNG